MSDLRILHLSDIHLSRAKAYNQQNWDMCLRYIDARKPDLVVIGGDMVLDDPDVEEDQYYARREMERINAPWKAIPGNHDVGDSLPNPYQGQPVTADRIARYVALYGPDRWSIDIASWRLVGMNSQLLGSGLSLEADQEDWLASVVASRGRRHLAIFVHKPLCVDSLAETHQSGFCVSPAGRRGILDILAGHDVRLIASGHTHRFRALSAGGMPMVWAPTTAQINTKMALPRPGLPDQSAGFVSYRFREGAVEWELVRPDGLRPLDVTAMVERYGAMRNAPAFAPSAELATA